MTELKEVNERLDSILLEFFEVTASLFNEQDNLNELLKDGFFNMSRARYNMGAKSVGELQYNDKEMRPLMKVDFEDKKFTLMSVDPNSDYDGASSQFSEKEGLRQRKVENVGFSEDEKGGIKLKDMNEKVKKKSNYDPLKWFGVLVPQALRQSQSAFKKSLELAVNVANLKMRLGALKNSYEELMCKKMELVKVES
ncbi:hypothetical protein FSP39_021860 [Pinctada imbricata]|uniref:Vacuolar ATPase assembly protein VMA22 n=1 Tax=Pinctada imbricata TaxID=66713 RepID=A0AA89C4D2_PINIB|nr:hypothetical protein FSP39_021860 [Pinctada imbricata]